MTSRAPLAFPVRALAFGALLATSCRDAARTRESPGPSEAPAVIESFTAETSSVFVGESTLLTAVFTGDDARIEGIGAVESGTPIATPPLARTTTFRLTVLGGSEQVEARVTVSATYRNRFRELASSPVARTQHVAVALADGGALVMGGNSSESLAVPDSDTSDRFDPAAETFSPGPQLALSAQAFWTTPAGLEGGGLLLVGGGINSGVPLGTASAILTQAFDPTTGRWNRAGDLAFRHDGGATATRLGDGSVLVAGGQIPALAATERYDPASRRWTPAGDMLTARRGHTATRLADGRVLLVGGIICCVVMNGELLTAAAEIFDPVDGRFEATGPLSMPRALHAAALLPDGRVLVTGGIIDAFGATTTSSEIFDPATGQFGPGGATQVGRESHSAIPLTDGRVLVLGGGRAVAATDVFDPASNRWSPGPELQPAWAASTATLLSNGKVLVHGGENAQGFPVSTVLLYE